MSNAIKDGERFYTNERGTAFVVYSLWDMGYKYKVYTVRGGKVKYYNSFPSALAAMTAANKIY